MTTTETTEPTLVELYARKSARLRWEARELEQRAQSLREEAKRLETRIISLGMAESRQRDRERGRSQ